MASVRDLMEFGRLLMFGQVSPAPIVTNTIPAGQPVMLGENERVAKWQVDAWRLWKQVGELHYPTTRLSRQTSQLDWRVRVDGRELNPESAKREMAAVTAGLGPRDATYLLALNDQVAGECWYVQTGPDRFEVYSTVEPDLTNKIRAARRSGFMALRMYQPDPTNPRKADSSVRTAIGPAEELLTLEALSQAQARSRLSQAGVIVTPAEQMYSDKDPWEANLLEAMTAAIKDVKSPSALAPIHIRMRRDLIDFVRYITFPRPYDDLIDRKQERAIRRVANALDIEPELILGLGEATYWNAWAVSMDTYQAHIAPRADRIGNLYADVATRLRAKVGQNVVIEITPDPRVMLARRSTTRDAFDAWKLGVVGPAYVRDAIGATDADAPTEEDIQLLERIQGRGDGTMDRERRIGENPGPARSNPDNATVVTDHMVAEHARKQVGLKLREAWRNTPHRNRLSGLLPSDYACHIPRSDIAREFPIIEVVRDAVREVAEADQVDRLTSWIMETLETPLSGLRAMEEVA